MAVPSGLKNIRPIVIDQAVLDVDMTAELVLFIPAKGLGREITVKIVKRQDAQIDEVNNETLEERIDVLAKVDAKLGILTPRLGDQIRRGPENDISDRPYVWTGEIEAKNAAAIVLIYSRRTDTARGVSP